MMKQERRTTYACHDYLNTTKTYQASINNMPKITASDRQRVIDWCYDIIDQCRLNRETIAVAMNLADQFMCAQTKCSNEMLYHRGQYQRLVITALYVAVKMNEPTIFSSSSADFAVVTHDTYTATELEAMEQTLVTTLEWRCCVPTPQQIGMHILELLKLHLIPSEAIHTSSPTWEFLEKEVAFQTQNALRDYFFAKQRSSMVAVISIINAIEQVNDIEFEPLMRILIVEILKKFEFEDSSTLLYSRHRLRLLIEDCQGEIEAEGEDDVSNSDTSSRTSCESEAESFVHIETYEGFQCHRQDENEQQKDASSSSQQDSIVSKEASQVVPLEGSDTHEVSSAALSFTSLRVIAIHTDGTYTPVTHTVI